jgi:hypothetical protein
LNKTDVAPVNPDPEMTTDVPVPPPAGVNKLMTGEALCDIVSAFEFAGLPVTQVAFDVSMQVITSPSAREELEKVMELEPTLTRPFFHW